MTGTQKYAQWANTEGKTRLGVVNFDVSGTLDREGATVVLSCFVLKRCKTSSSFRILKDSSKCSINFKDSSTASKFKLQAANSFFPNIRFESV
jgi:hypothetical protein